MLVVIAIWAAAEAIRFFIVADVAVMALGVKAGVRKALVGAGVAAVCAAIGGTYIFQWSSTDPKEVIELMISVPAIDEALLAKVWEDWREGEELAMVIGSFSGVPYKLYAYAAGSAAGQQSLFGLGWFFLVLV